jgi:hypothetical protein
MLPRSWLRLRVPTLRCRLSAAHRHPTRRWPASSLPLLPPSRLALLLLLLRCSGGGLPAANRHRARRWPALPVPPRRLALLLVPLLLKCSGCHEQSRSRPHPPCYCLLPRPTPQLSSHRLPRPAQVLLPWSPPQQPLLLL